MHLVREANSAHCDTEQRFCEHTTKIIQNFRSSVYPIIFIVFLYNSATEFWMMESHYEVECIHYGLRGKGIAGNVEERYREKSPLLEPSSVCLLMICMESKTRKAD